MKETSQFRYLLQSVEYKDAGQSIMMEKIQNFQKM